MIALLSCGRPRSFAFLGVALGVFCVQLDSFALNLALPHIGRDIGTESLSLQWIVSSYLLSAGKFMMAGGRLADLFGRRLMFIAGLIGFGSASLLCAIASSLPALICARFLQGIGAALIMPVGLALLTNTFPPNLRTKASAYALAIGGLAQVCGPFIGGALTESSSWRSVFWLNVIPISLAAFCAFRAAENSDGHRKNKVDWPGLISGTGAIAALVALVERGPVWGWSSWCTYVSLAVTVMLAALFIRSERRVSNPLVDLSLFVNRTYVPLMIAGAIANIATVFFLFVVPMSLQNIWGLSASQTGLMFLAPATVMAAIGSVAGNVRNPACVMACCIAIAGLGLVFIAMAPHVLLYLAAITCCAAPLGLANVVTLTATQSVIGVGRAGEVSGVTKTIITIAGGIGLALTGPVSGHDAAGAANRALVGVGIAIALFAVLLGFWQRYTRSH